MKTFIRLVAVFCLLSIPALAQDTPKAEIFGGYSYFHSDGGGSLHGWNASVAGNLSRWLGIVADFSGHYGDESQSVNFTPPGGPSVIANAELNSRVHNVLVGPRVSYRKKSSITPFAHVMVGISRIGFDGSANATIDGDTVSFDFDESDTGFAMAVGGGLDVNLSKKVALRAVQADYVLNRFGGDNLNNLRLSVGLVLRFGER